MFEQKRKNYRELVSTLYQQYVKDTDEENKWLLLSAFWIQNQVGLTLSGGEPLFQFEFAMDILKKAKEKICILPSKPVASLTKKE